MPSNVSEHTALITETSLGIINSNTFQILIKYQGLKGAGSFSYDCSATDYLNHGMAIKRVLDTLMLSRWEQIVVGTPIRVRREEGGSVVAIGHAFQDRWFDIRGLRQ